MTEHVERFEISVDSTREDVWRRLTTREGLESWFGTRAEIELRAGGPRVVGWGDDVAIKGEISKIDPENRLRVVYIEEGQEVGAEEWIIETGGGTVRVTLIHSMSDDEITDWEGFYGDVRRGWRLFLASLKFALEDAVVPDRSAECLYAPAEGERSQIWERISAFASSDVAGGLTPLLVDAPHSLLLGRPDRSILVDIEGSGPQQAVYAQVACHGDVDRAWMASALAEAARI